MRSSLAILMVTSMTPLSALAATPQTAVLDVQNMNCNLCPVTVKKSLELVPGVSQARIDFGKKTATVTFDATKVLDGATIQTATGKEATIRIGAAYVDGPADPFEARFDDVVLDF